MAVLDSVSLCVQSQPSVDPGDSGPAPGPAGLVSIGKLAEAVGLHVASLRRLDGKLPSFVLPSGHRRYRLAECLAFLRRNGIVGTGDDQKAREIHADNGSTVPICLVTRVSTSKDSQKSSLVNQRERLETYVKDHFGGASTAIYWNERIASGLNLEHPKVMELVDLILSGKLNGGYLICTFKDRLVRFGWGVFERLCQLHNVQLKYIDEQDGKSETDELQQDLLSVLTSFTAKANGNKVRKLYGVKIDHETASLILSLRSQKLGVKIIARELKKQGKHADVNGRLISERVIYKFLKRNGKVLRKLSANAAISLALQNDGSDPLTRFIGERVDRDGTTSRHQFKAFYSAYSDWCKANGLLTQPMNVVSQRVRAAGFRMTMADGRRIVHIALRAA